MLLGSIKLTHNLFIINIIKILFCGNFIMTDFKEQRTFIKFSLKL